MGEPGPGNHDNTAVPENTEINGIPPDDIKNHPYLIRVCATSGECDEKYTYLLGVIQEIRVESKNLWELFCDMETEINNKQSPEEIADIVQPYQKIYQANKTEIGTLITATRTIIDRDPGFKRHMGDEIRSIENYWERFTQFYPDLHDAKGDKILHGLQKCKGYLSEIVFQCSYRTIPERLMDHLKNMEVPQAQNFYDLFKDEVCTKEQADSILKSLSKSSKILKARIKKDDQDKKLKKGADVNDSYECVIGAVDSIQGLVYRVGSITEQWISVAGILVAGILMWILSLGILTIYKFYINPAWTIASGSILVFFIVLMGGAVAHIAIDILKEARSDKKTRDIQAISDLLLWTHIKMFPIISSIVILGIGFLTLAIATPGIGAETYFVAGYSIDSIGDLYLDRFDSVMSAKSDVLKKDLAIS